jgi:hypothetical protein
MSKTIIIPEKEVREVIRLVKGQEKALHFQLELHSSILLQLCLQFKIKPKDLADLAGQVITFRKPPTSDCSWPAFHDAAHQFTCDIRRVIKCFKAA